MPSAKAIQSFLARAKRHGYDAGVKSQKSLSRPGIDILRYPRPGSPRSSTWFWEDIWVGSNPFSGTATVWYKGKPCYQNHYWGSVVVHEDAELVYTFLRWARRQLWDRPRQNTVVGQGRFRGFHYCRFTEMLSGHFFSEKKYETIVRRRQTVCEVFEIKGIVR